MRIQRLKINRAFSIVELKQMNRNKLKMNTEKTKYVIVRSVRKKWKGNISLKCLDGSEIEHVEKNEIFRHNY